MPKNYDGLTASDVIIIDEVTGEALVRSASKPNEVYNVNWLAKTCDCPNYIYVRKDLGEICKHIRGVLMVVNHNIKKNQSRTQNN